MNLSQLDTQKQRRFIQAVDAYTGIGLLTASNIFSDPPKCAVMAFFTKECFLKPVEIVKLVSWIESENNLPMPVLGAPHIDVVLTEEDITEALIACATAKLKLQEEKIASADIILKDVFRKDISYPKTALISIELVDEE